MKRLSSAILIIGMVAVGYAILRKNPSPPEPAPVAVAETRAVYPWSIIPGGVRSLEELRRALRDETVAKNFAGFDISHARFERLTQAECSYVSFRRGSEIGWTKHCIRLLPGELILTDGRMRFRAKCGNRISDMPQVPAWDVDTARMEIPIPDMPTRVLGTRMNVPGETPVEMVPAEASPTTASEPPPVGPRPDDPVAGPPLAPPAPPLVPVCCLAPRGRKPRVSVDAGEDWKIEASAGVVVLLILYWRRRVA